MNEKVVKMNLSEINIDSSLGLLAFGDLAFTAWRQVKKQAGNQENEEK